MTRDVGKDYTDPLLAADDGTFRISGWNSEGDCSILLQTLADKKALTPSDIELSSPQYDDWRWGGAGINPVGSASPATLTEVTTREWSYVFANGNFMAFHDLQIPHDYKEGTDILPHIHVASSTDAAATGTFTMNFFGILGAGQDVAPEAELTLTAAISIPANKYRRGYTFDFNGVIPGAGRTISSCGTIQLSYALTSGDGIIMRGFDGHYQKDRLGSRQEYLK